jgi:hypothetical protein
VKVGEAVLKKAPGVVKTDKRRGVAPAKKAREWVEPSRRRSEPDQRDAPTGAYVAKQVVDRLRCGEDVGGEGQQRCVGFHGDGGVLGCGLDRRDVAPAVVDDSTAAATVT